MPETSQASRELQIVFLREEHASVVARLHIEGIHTGFLSSLGEPFVTALYEAIARSPSSFGYVVLLNDQIAGYIAFTDNLKNLYRSILRAEGIRFFRLLAGHLRSFSTMKKILETLFYPKRIEKLNLPDAEFLAIVLDSSIPDKGMSFRLIQTCLQECRRRNLSAVKTLVADDNKKANILFRMSGFHLKNTIDNHGIRSNIYVMELL